MTPEWRWEGVGNASDSLAKRVRTALDFRQNRARSRRLYVVRYAIEVQDELGIMEVRISRRLGASPSQYSRWTEVKTMTVLEFVALAALLLEFVSRVIELALVIRSALLTRRGKERQQ